MSSSDADFEPPCHDRGLVHLRTRPHRQIISHGETALVMDQTGEIRADEDTGLFVRGTRVLSAHAWRAGGRGLIPVSVSPARQDQWHGYYLLPARTEPDKEPRAPAAQQGIEVYVSRIVGEGMHEDIRVTNHSHREVSFVLALRADADFVGQDEAGGEPPRRGRISARIADDAEGVDRRWQYRARRTDPRDGCVRTLSLSLRLAIAHPAEPSDDAGDVRFRLRLQPQQAWRTCLSWRVDWEDEALPSPPCPAGHSAALRERVHPAWLRSAAAVSDARGGGDAGQVDVVDLLERARRDLHALRIPRSDTADGWTVGAGVPAYLATFGRDILTAGWQSAMLGCELMQGGLAVMAETQGSRRDDWRDEAPGRMLHEARSEPAAWLNERPTGRYYGSLTSAGLFPFVVGQLWQWTGDAERVQAFIEPALRALRWMDEEAMQVPGPFYAVRTRSPKGLDNQTWKDSSESIVDLDGRVVPQPVATCEEQAIVYVAKRDLAAVLDALGRNDEARTLRQQAEELKMRFNDRFWLPSTEFLAMALDPDGQPIASIGSNALRCLASGIVAPEIAAAIVKRAFAPDMFSGWGIRTLSSQHAAYNPHGYHVGTVWPVEHGPFAFGLREYGYVERCQQLCLAQFQLAGLCEGQRLPECVSGHTRDAMHPFPAIYAAANAPQAWSASTPVVLLQALLGMRAEGVRNTLWLDPCLPSWLPDIRLNGVRIGRGTVDLHFRRADDGTTQYDVTAGDDIVRVRRGVPEG